MLTDRASLLREFHRITNTDANDADFTEHDGSTLEGAYQLLQQGADDAQAWLISNGMGAFWANETSALTFSGSDPNRYALLPTDFLRLMSDEWTSGLRKTNGDTWGREVSYERRNRMRGNFFYVAGVNALAGGGSEGRYGLYLAKDADPPSGMVADYYSRIATLADSTDADMPQAFRGLIVAMAAQRAVALAWFAGDVTQVQLIDRYIQHEKREASRRARMTNTSKKAEPQPTFGDHWFA